MSTNNSIYEIEPVEFDPFTEPGISTAVSDMPFNEENSKLKFATVPVEFDPFGEPESSPAIAAVNQPAKNGKPVYHTSPIDFDPFAGPSISLIAPATEPQVEIWTSCLIGEVPASCAYNESAYLTFNRYF